MRRSILTNKKMNKKGVVQLIYLIPLIASLITILAFMDIIDVASILGTSESVYKTRIGSLGCIEDDAPSITTKYADQNYIYTCGGTALVDSCEVRVTCGDTPFYLPNCGVNYKINDGSRVVVVVNEYSDKQITVLQPGDKIEISSTNADVTKIDYITHFYRLWTEEGGGHWLTRSADCCMANQDEITRRDVFYGDWTCLEKSGSLKYKNYVIDWIKTEGVVYSYLGDKVVCANNILYDLDVEQMADGNSYYIQGEAIKAVQCCPYQTSSCSDNFEFVEAGDERTVDCTYSTQCENLGNPYAVSRTVAVKEVCIDGTCQQTEIDIECNSDAACVSLYGDNWVCELSNYNFGTCIKQTIVQPYCGDGYCSTGETKDNCIADCEIECPIDWKLVTNIKKVNCNIGFPLYWGCDQQIERTCIKAQVNWLLWIAVVIGVLLLFTFGKPLLLTIRMWLKMIPIVGKFIP